MSKKKHLSLNSSTDEVYKLEGFVDQLQQWADFNDDIYGNIMLTLSEAVSNAIIHGNKENPEKEIKVSAWLNGGSIKISVKDEGEGFDPDALPDPLKAENLLKEGGRGVFLMGQYADNVEYSEQGNKLTLTFKI